jgi:hypothetical protein
MTRVSVNVRLDLAQHEALDALDALREAVVRGRDALASVAELKDEKKNAQSPRRLPQTTL